MPISSFFRETLALSVYIHAVFQDKSILLHAVLYMPYFVT